LLLNTNAERVIIFSRDELKQFEMQSDPLLAQHKKRIRYFLGDVRDQNRLNHAFKCVDLVVHAAALKQVVPAEYNPIEAIKTNVLGAQNIIEAAIECGVKRVIALSTDKAAAPINLYGATKLCADKLFVAANNFVGGDDTRFSVVRYGNVFGSRGSIVPYFLANEKSWKTFPVTDDKMTRFSLTLKQGVSFVEKCVTQAAGGEIFIPKIPSYRITDLCQAINKDMPIEITGIRPGEKLHEALITAYDIPNTYEWEHGYAILPQFDNLNQHRTEIYKEKYTQKTNLTEEYSSEKNTEWLDVKSLSSLVDLYRNE
jgi:UDP-N-acetylglucosamine 4,6-dehydratase